MADSIQTQINNLRTLQQSFDTLATDVADELNKIGSPKEGAGYTTLFEAIEYIEKLMDAFNSVSDEEARQYFNS